MKNNAKKREVSNDLILREDGMWQGGVSVMVSLGLRYEGVGALRFAPKGGRMNAADYIEIVTNTYLPDCNKFYGVPPPCVFMQGGASSHTAKAARDFRAKKSPFFRGKKVWPPCSPDLNP